MLTLQSGYDVSLPIEGSDGHLYDAKTLQAWARICIKSGNGVQVIPGQEIRYVRLVRVPGLGAALDALLCVTRRTRTRFRTVVYSLVYCLVRAVTKVRTPRPVRQRFPEVRPRPRLCRHLPRAVVLHAPVASTLLSAGHLCAVVRPVPVYT